MAASKARLNRRQIESVRENIQATYIVNRLTSHIAGDVDLSSSQVTAALGLLKKAVPDLKVVDGELDLKGSLELTLVSYADATPEQLGS